MSETVFDSSSWLYGAIKKAIGDDSNSSEEERIREEDLARLCGQVGDALVDWMGPGGDPAFLDFYALANHDVMSTGIWNPLLSVYVLRVDQIRFVNALDSQKNVVAGFAEYRRDVMRNIAYYALSGDVPRSSFSDRSLHRIAKGSPEVSDDQFVPEILAAQRAIVVGLIPIPMPIYRVTEYLALGLYPRADYRTLLMGEMACPWENLPPPYDLPRLDLPKAYGTWDDEDR